MTAEQYEAAIETIKSTFGDTSQAEQEHLLTIAKIFENNTPLRIHNLGYVINEVEQNINAFKVLGVHKQPLSFAITPLIVKTLPNSIKINSATWLDLRKDTQQAEVVMT